MRITNYILTNLILLVFALPAMTQSYSLSENSQLKVIGTSNIHDWETQAQAMKGSAVFSMSEDGKLDIRSAKVTIPVEKLESSKGSIMDNKTYKALDSDKHPNIIYELTKVSNVSKAGDGWKAQTTGTLNIAGTSKPVQFTVQGKQEGSNTYRWTGSTSLKMSDFNVDPPTAMFGALKTADDVTIEFNVIFTSK